MTSYGPSLIRTCPTCGAPMADSALVEHGERRRGLAITSIVLGVIGIVTLGALSLLGVLGIAFGFIALNRARRNPAVYGGKGVATAGIVANSCAILLGVIAAVVLATIVMPVRIEGVAMLPTLRNGDRAFVWRQIETVDRGDLVIFWYPDDPSKSFIKRVVGLPGEAIRIDNAGVVYINGHALDEPYLSPEYNRMPRDIPDTFVKSHYYFVLGDNRDSSNDSRSWGLVPEKYIYGKLIGKY